MRARRHNACASQVPLRWSRHRSTGPFCTDWGKHIDVGASQNWFLNRTHYYKFIIIAANNNHNIWIDIWLAVGTRDVLNLYTHTTHSEKCDAFPTNSLIRRQVEPNVERIAKHRVLRRLLLFIVFRCFCCGFCSAFDLTLACNLRDYSRSFLFGFYRIWCTCMELEIRLGAKRRKIERNCIFKILLQFSLFVVFIHNKPKHKINIFILIQVFLIDWAVQLAVVLRRKIQ